ncbi:hypothetical protein [Mesorhizobium sp. M0088]|uniref:hypothetical protein n=1 Tax=Mesorhizobium sp. M0088 TaxID=2956873 RepID=UPI00333A9A87
MSYIGDFPEDFTTVSIMFTTHAASGAAVAPSTGFEAADVILYKNGSATQKATTNGITMTSPFDSVTGLHCLVIDTSVDTGDVGFWTAGAHYTAVLSPDETVDSLAVVKVIATFSLALAPVFARLGAPAGASVSADVAAVKAVLPAALVSGRIDASVGAMAAAVLTATAIAADAITDAKVASDVTIASVAGAVGSVTGAVGSVTGNVGGNVTGSVGSVATGGITAGSIATDAIGASELAADAVTEIATGVWAATTRLLTAGTNIALAKGTGVTGFNDLDAAGVRGAIGLASANLDTQIDALPTNAELTAALAGSDDVTLAAIAALNNLSAAQVNAEADAALANAGVTGVRMGHLDADVTSRLASGAYTAPDNATIASIDGKASTILAGVVAIDDKTTNLPSDPADQSLIIAATNAIQSSIGGLNDLSAADVSAQVDIALADAALATAADLAATDGKVDAVQAKTDGLTFSGAAVDANIAKVNGVTVEGGGTTGNEWGPA